MDTSSVLRIGGMYSFGGDPETGPFGSVLVHPLSDSVALFFVDVNRGGPSYNMGQLQGEMTIKNNVGRYSHVEEFYDCELEFEFAPSQLSVSTDMGRQDCGFGHGVYADHTYDLIDPTIPDFFIYGPGDTIWFEDLR